jgi:hypothetical protein
VTTGAASLGAAAGASAFAALSAGGRGGVVGGIAGTGLLVLVAALVFRRHVLVPWAVLAVGGGYLSGRLGHDVVDGWAAAVGVLLLLGAELAAWSIESDARIRAERAVVVQRVTKLAALSAAAGLVDVAVLGASGLSGGAGVVVAAAGVAAAVSAVALVARLARNV